MPTLLMILVTVVWGASFLFIKLALEEISTISFIFLRFLVATISMLPVFFSSAPFQSKEIKKGLILGALQIGIIFLQTWGLETISTSLSGFLTGFYIVFVLIIKFRLQKKVPNLLDTIASLMCITGLGLLTHSFKITNGLGVCYTLGSAFFVAIFIYAVDRYATDSNSLTLTFIQMLSITLFSGSLFLIPGNILQIPSNLMTWISIIFCGVFCSSIAFWWQNLAQRRLGPFKVSIILMLEPVFCTVFGYYLLDEKLYIESYIGIIMIFISIGAINLRLNKI